MLRILSGADARWVQDAGLKDRYGVLRLFVALDESPRTGGGYAYWVSPGPMQRSGNYEYVLMRREGKLYLPTEEEIEVWRKGMGETFEGIGSGRIRWFEPSGSMYGFGISLTVLDGGMVEVQFRGRPNNAVGKSLDLGSLVVPLAKAEGILHKYSTEKAIRGFLRKFDGKSPSYI